MSAATEAEGPPEPSPLFRLFLAWLVPAVAVAVTVQPVAAPIYDPDVWWHLAVGKWVVEHRAVTAFDPFSQVGDAKPWLAYSWLYEVALFGLYSAFGLAGVIVFRVAVSLLIVRAFHALVTRLERRYLVAIGLTAAAVLALQPLLSERPWLLTVLFSVITLHAVVALRQPAERLPRWVWALPLVFIVWANVHIQFVYGLFLLGLACLAPWLDARLGLAQPPQTAAAPASRRYRQLVGLSGLCLLGTLVNPYTVWIYGVVLEYATQPGPFLWVNELKAPGFRAPTDWVMLALTAAAVFALGRRTVTTFTVLLLAAAAVLAFRSQRDIWFVVLADLTVLASAGPREAPAREQFAPGPAGRAAILSGLAVLIAVLAWARDLRPGRLAEVVADHFPAAAAAHVAEKGYPGPLFNDFNWGGYLIWALPRLPVAIDGRTNLHGDERMKRFGDVWGGVPGWDGDPDLAAAGVVIAEARQPLVSLLRLDRRFREVYADEVAVVFIRAPRPAQQE